jgi:endonuclease III
MLSAVAWREVDGNVVWQMVVDHHVAVVRVAVTAALVKAHTNQVLQDNVHNKITDEFLGHLHLYLTTYYRIHTSQTGNIGMQ